MKTQVIEAVSLSNYLSITRAAGLPDSLAEETYAENKDSADRLTEFKLKSDIERGDVARNLSNIGYNSGDTEDVGGVAGKRLLSFIERVERLTEEKDNLQEDIKEVYSEAKSIGFDAPTIRRIVAERKKDPEKRNEQLELFDLYKSAIGMV